MIKKYLKFLLWGSLFLGLILALFIFVPQVAHAQDLHTDLTSPGTAGGSDWVFVIWKIMLGIADVFVVMVLLVLAIVNILHIQYDTYQIKKALPALIGGVIASNFSILLCRMIVDFAQVLTSTFAQDPTRLATGYLCALGVTSNNMVVFIGSGVFGTFLIIILETIAILIAVCILAFLLWIRKTVIFLLVAISPVAMLLYAFPPTQGLFKQWWGQFIRWAFVGPILMALIWVASEIGHNNCGASYSVSVTLTVVGISILAAIIPFRLGGAVMGAWGNLGKKSAKYGAKKADYGMQRYGGKYAKYAPTAQWDKYKLNKARKEEEVRGETLASARGDRYKQAFQAGLSNKRFKEDFLDTYGSMSKDVAQKSLDEAVKSGNMTALQGSMAAAAKEGFINDQMDAISDNDDRGKNLRNIVKQKYKAATGRDLTDAELSADALKTHEGKAKIYQALFLKNESDQEGLAKINRIQDAATVDGDWAAMDVFEENGKLRMLNRNDATDRKSMERVWGARLQSGNARQNVGKTRKDTFATEKEREFFINSMSPEMINSMTNMRSGAGAALREGAAGGTGMQLLRSTPQGRQYLDLMARRGLIARNEVDPPTTLRVTTPDQLGRPQERIVNVSQLEAADLSTLEVRTKIEADIVGKANDLTRDDLDKFADSVSGNTNISEPVRRKLEIHKSWESKVKNAAEISQTNAGLAEQQANALADEIHGDLAEAVQSSVDIPIKMKRIIDAIPSAERARFLPKLEKDLKASDVTALTIQNQPISYRKILEVRDQARQKATQKGKFNKETYQIELGTALDKLSPEPDPTKKRIDSASYDQILKIFDIFKGEKPSVSSKPSSNGETEEEAAARDEEENEEFR